MLDFVDAASLDDRVCCDDCRNKITSQQTFRIKTGYGQDAYITRVRTVEVCSKRLHPCVPGSLHRCDGFIAKETTEAHRRALELMNKHR